MFEQGNESNFKYSTNSMTKYFCSIISNNLITNSDGEREEGNDEEVVLVTDEQV
jgi:hypothetical protein